MKITLSSVGSWWLRCLKRGNEAVRLLGLRVRIPLEAWRPVCFEYCQVDDVSLSG